MITIIIMPAFLQKDRQAFQVTLLRGERYCLLLIPTITHDYRNYSIFQFRPCLLYTLVSGRRGCAREMRMALSQLHFLASTD